LQVHIRANFIELHFYLYIMLIKLSSNIYNKNHNEQKDYRKNKRVTQTDKFTFVDISIYHLVEAEF
jgi:hypothetical protein